MSHLVPQTFYWSPVQWCPDRRGEVKSTSLFIFSLSRTLCHQLQSIIYSILGLTWHEVLTVERISVFVRGKVWASVICRVDDVRLTRHHSKREKERSPCSDKLCNYFCGAAKSNWAVRVKKGRGLRMANQSQQQLNTVNHGSDLTDLSSCVEVSVRVCECFNVLK